MPELNFSVIGVEAVRHAAVPQLVFRLRIEQPWADVSGEVASAPAAIRAISLVCQIRIEPTRRRYEAASHDRLRDLFGEPERWSQTMRHMLWTHASASVPSFEQRVEVDLPVPCSFDFNLAATKYFHALDDGEIPLCLLFSGTVFYHDEQDRLQVTQVPWEKEATFRLPVAAWRAMMDHYYPNSAWLCLQRDTFERLAEYKSRHSLPTWEQAIEQLLKSEPLELDVTP